MTDKKEWGEQYITNTKYMISKPDDIICKITQFKYNRILKIGFSYQ